MTDSRYVPRNLSEESIGFGRAEALKWRSGNGVVELNRIQAARLQHFYALRIRKRIADELLTPKQFAAKAGISYDRLMKILRGEMIMRLEDIAAADLVLGEVSEIAISDARRRRQVHADPKLTAAPASSRR